MKMKRIVFPVVVLALLFVALFLVRDQVISPDSIGFEEIPASQTTLKSYFTDSALLYSHHDVRREGNTMYITVYGNLFSIKNQTGEFQLELPEDVTHLIVEDNQTGNNKLVWEKE